jgi:hypothetical protein
VELKGIEPSTSRVRFASSETEGHEKGRDRDGSPAPDAAVGVRADSLLTPAEAPERSLRDDLADVIARAVREGDFETAGKLVEVLKAQRSSAAPVVQLVPVGQGKRGGAG